MTSHEEVMPKIPAKRSYVDLKEGEVIYNGIPAGFEGFRAAKGDTEKLRRKRI